MNKEPILLLFGHNVQKYRKELGLSQERLAELAGVHRTYIGMVERAEKNIHSVTLKRLLKHLTLKLKICFNMITIHTVTIIEKTRADYRRTLTELFLSEAPGAAGIPTKYEYNVETDNAGNIIYLKRPTNLNKGFDFEVRVSNMRFKHINKNGRISYSNRPSHDNIIDDLAEKKAEDSSQFTLLLTVIDAIFNCVEIDPQIYCKFSFRSGYPVDMICKCIKWLFIEQDITYWNWSGRNMLYNGIKNV